MRLPSLSYFAPRAMPLPRAAISSLLPAGLVYASDVQHSMTMALLGTMFTSLLVATLIALFFFASQHTCRKTYIFWMNVAVVALGIVEGVYLVGIEVTLFLSTSNAIVAELFAGLDCSLSTYS